MDKLPVSYKVCQQITSQLYSSFKIQLQVYVESLYERIEELKIGKKVCQWKVRKMMDHLETTKEENMKSQDHKKMKENLQQQEQPQTELIEMEDVAKESGWEKEIEKDLETLMVTKKQDEVQTDYVDETDLEMPMVTKEDERQDYVDETDLKMPTVIKEGEDYVENAKLQIIQLEKTESVSKLIDIHQNIEDVKQLLRTVTGEMRMVELKLVDSIYQLLAEDKSDVTLDNNLPSYTKLARLVVVGGVICVTAYILF